MTKLIITVDVDEDPTINDPHDVAQALLVDSGDHQNLAHKFSFVGAEWQGGDDADG